MNQLHQPNNSEPMDEGLNTAQLEAQLQHALQPQAAPEGFAERVLAAAAMQATAPAPRVTPIASRRFGLRRPARWMSAAAAVLILGVGSLQYQIFQQRQRLRGEAARQQVLLALRITGSKLHRVQVRLNPDHPELDSN